MRLVRDVTICAQMPNFPEDLHRQVHALVTRYGVFSLPVNAPPRDFGSLEDFKRLMHQLSSELHSVFHALVRRRAAEPFDAFDSPLVTFTDDPRAPLRALYAVGEEVREGMVGNATEDA
jgi:hypothetical protein